MRGQSCAGGAQARRQQSRLPRALPGPTCALTGCKGASSCSPRQVQGRGEGATRRPPAPSPGAPSRGGPEVVFAPRHCVTAAPARGCSPASAASLPTLPRTSRIFSPSHRLPGVWSGSWGRERVDRSVRGRQACAPHFPTGNQKPPTGGSVQGPSLPWPLVPPRQGRGGEPGNGFRGGVEGSTPEPPGWWPPRHPGILREAWAPAEVRPGLSPGIWGSVRERGSQACAGVGHVDTGQWFGALERPFL